MAEWQNHGGELESVEKCRANAAEIEAARHDRESKSFLARVQHPAEGGEERRSNVASNKGKGCSGKQHAVSEPPRRHPAGRPTTQ